MQRHDMKWKKQEVTTLVELFNKYPTVAVANLDRFPTSLFQVLRKKLQGKAVFKVTKTKVAQRALEQSKKKVSGIGKYVKDSCCIIFTTIEPFEFHSFIKKNKGNVYAKEGNLAPEDIIIPAGDTGLPPGPALSDLKQAGLNVRPMGATIHIIEDKVVTKKGEPVAKAVAATLSKLDIRPIKVVMNLLAAYDGTQLYEGKVLDIDLDQVFENFKSAHFQAFNLALNLAYLTPATLPLLLRKATFDSMNLALNANIYTEETIKVFLSKANIEATILKGMVKEPAEPAPEAAAEQPAQTGEKLAQ